LGKVSEWRGSIPLDLQPGINNIEVIVTDVAGQTDVQAIRVNFMQDLPSLVGFYDRVWAVVIGIDNYKDKDIPPLNYAVRDARAVADTLRDKFFVSRVIALYNEEATHENISRVLKGEVMGAGERDAVLIYFAGHGITFDTPDGPMGYLVPHDGSIDRRQLFRNFSMYSLREEVGRVCPAKDLLVIADACYGGLMATRDIEVVQRSKQAEGPDAYLRWLRDRRWRGVMTAGAAEERVLDSGPGGHSTFTGPLLNILRLDTPYITASELFGKLTPSVVAASSKLGHQHTPQWATWSEDGDFVFIRK